VEGYGQTEVSACATATRYEDSDAGYVGSPAPCMEIRLEEIPEMNYFATDVDSEGRNCPRGEICFRAPSQFHRYYKDPEKTAETID